MQNQLISHVPPAHYMVKINSFSLLAKNVLDKYESGEFVAGRTLQVVLFLSLVQEVSIFLINKIFVISVMLTFVSMILGNLLSIQTEKGGRTWSAYLFLLSNKNYKFTLFRLGGPCGFSPVLAWSEPRQVLNSSRYLFSFLSFTRGK